MRLFLLILCTTIIAHLASLVFPWWMVLAIPALVGAFTSNRSLSAFFISSAPIALLWTGLCLVSMAADNDLPSRVATLFYLPHPALLLLLTVLLGSLLSGFAGWSLFIVRKAADR